MSDSHLLITRVRTSGYTYNFLINPLSSYQLRKYLVDYKVASTPYTGFEPELIVLQLIVSLPSKYSYHRQQIFGVSFSNPVSLLSSVLTPSTIIQGCTDFLYLDLHLLLLSAFSREFNFLLGTSRITRSPRLFSLKELQHELLISYHHPVLYTRRLHSYHVDHCKSVGSFSYYIGRWLLCLMYLPSL